MSYATYSDKLRHPKWQVKRLKIIERDGAKCKLCSDSETELHIHHEYYTKNTDPWDYPDEALTALCKHCHSAVEMLKDEQATALLIAKRVHADEEHVTVCGIAKSKEGNKCLFISLYRNSTCECELLASASPETSQHIKTLIELSEKL